MAHTAYAAMGALSYIARIRNPQKRQYARDYWQFLHGGPEPEFDGLSYMAAQVVRITLHAYTEGR